MSKVIEYDNPKVGCYVDESAGSADECNKRTIELAEGYGFQSGNPSGCIDGLRGTSILMTMDEAESASHQGQCDEDAENLSNEPHISSQLDAIGVEKLQLAIKETGGWPDDWTNDTENRVRAVWLAAGDIVENAGQWLSEVGDEAVAFLNSLEHRSFMYWTFEDNSLFLMVDVDGAKEDVGFVSSKEQDYPPDDYRGEWLHVSDHGNATLYVRGEDGQDKEVWGVV